MWKNEKYIEKVQWKCAKTAISGVFPVFSAGKKIFSKIGLGHILGIINTHLWAKNQKKLMMKSRENAKKPVFPAFSAGKIHFSKIGHGHILDNAILHQCAKFHEEIWVTTREIQVIPFFRRNRLFRRFLESSGYKISLIDKWTMLNGGHCY